MGCVEIPPEDAREFQENEQLRRRTEAFLMEGFYGVGYSMEKGKFFGVRVSAPYVVKPLFEALEKNDPEGLR